jgi:beta-galactosidase
MLPHAGEDSAVFRGVVELGARLRALDGIAGTGRTPARAAVVFDWESWWTAELDSHPSDRLRYRQEALDWYTALLNLGIRADVVPTGAPLERYDLLIAPILHVVPGALAERLRGYVAGGGHLVTTYFSGVVDEHDRVWLGGYPGALRDLLGIRIEEFAPLLDEQSVELDNGTTGTLWTDRVDVTDPGTEVLAWYKTGDQTGRAAITRRRAGPGSAAYVSTRLGAAGLTTVLADLAGRAGITGELPEPLRGHVELAVRGDYWFLINRTGAPVDTSGVAGERLGAATPVLEPHGVQIVHRRAS